MTEHDEGVRGVDFTGLALRALEDTFFVPALDVLEREFAEQPLLQARLRQTVAAVPAYSAMPSRRPFRAISDVADDAPCAPKLLTTGETENAFAFAAPRTTDGPRARRPIRTAVARPSILDM